VGEIMRAVFNRIFVIVGLIILALGIYHFSEMNQSGIQLYFLKWRTLEISVGMMFLLAFTAGVLLSVLSLTTFIVQLSFEKRRLKRELEAMQSITQAHQKSADLPH
jgi:uncharacterized integral membrane protein